MAGQAGFPLGVDNLFELSFAEPWPKGHKENLTKHRIVGKPWETHDVRQRPWPQLLAREGVVAEDLVAADACPPKHTPKHEESRTFRHQ